MLVLKLLHVKANNFKNCKDGVEIDFVAISKKTSEDKECEDFAVLQDFIYDTFENVFEDIEAY